MSLVRRDGVLFLGDGRQVTGGLKRRSTRALGVRGRVVGEYRLERLRKNMVGAALDRLDEKLSPARGLRRLREKRWHPAEAIRAKKPILLLVHGTFSNNDNLLREMKSTKAGKRFLTWAEDRYVVLGFDHPTLAVSPMLNARELARAMVRFEDRPIDVVCHSRGGLVTRWWLEAFDPGDTTKRRAIFLGSPLAGTGLAAPPNIRATLSLLANISEVLGKLAGKGATAHPFLAVASGLFQIVRSITSLASKTPAVDAALALIPGLTAMSRVGNNHELISLRRDAPGVRGRYFVVRSNFEPTDPRWKFWRYFTKSQAANLAADAVFDGQNDLVVDTPSMTGFSSKDGFRFPGNQLQDFGTSESVHHTNYLRQVETLDFIRHHLSK
jgi:hypothetical protein